MSEGDDACTMDKIVEELFWPCARRSDTVINMGHILLFTKAALAAQTVNSLKNR